ncbi:RluA family pseudouridine synthase [Companilactobacillus sp. DQM5]|uniref:RluA family pseudouridine synthase n=1 Tax=Companilactobacillus sp. DQM5 TaxID=3463359 RepID=UPI004059BA8F
MIFKWVVKKEDKKIVRSFLKQKNFSSSQISKIKNHDGQIFVNKKERYLNYSMPVGATIIVKLPTEIGSKKIKAITGDLDIKFEDDFYLIVSKPSGLASLPARKKESATMANYIKAYLQQKGEESDAVHVVTRLDRDTSGLMIFAKNSFSHSLISKKLHSNDFTKQYIAVVENSFNSLEKSEINLPIGISDDFYMKRIVSGNGKKSLTKYTIMENFDNGSVAKINLITGRTHQIRVHFSAIGHPLYGDELYGGSMQLIKRQALHCFRLKFIHPITKEIVDVNSHLPSDIESLIDKLRK